MKYFVAHKRIKGEVPWDIEDFLQINSQQHSRATRYSNANFFFIQYHALQIKCIVISFIIIIIIIIIIIVQIFPLLLSNFILHVITRYVKITGCPKQHKHLSSG